MARSVVVPPGRGPAVATEPYVEQAGAAFDAGARFPLARAFQNIHRRADEAVPRTDRPTLVVWGGADESHRSDAHASSDRLLEGGNPSRRVVMEDVGHFPELEAPDRFSRELLTFLEALRGRTATGTGLAFGAELQPRASLEAVKTLAG